MRKIALEGGGFAYKKPTKAEGGYTPLKRSMNHWYFADLSKNISEQVLAIGEAYNQRIKEGSIKHINSHPVQLLRYFYFLYLTGSRLMEPTRTPTPRIVLSNTEGKVYIEVQKVNEKHKSPDGKDSDVIVQALPVFNEAEQRMWNFITDGGMSLNAEDIFELSQWKSTTKYNMNGLIKSNFKADLRDPNGKLHKNQGITPHILRHMRAYSVIVNYGAEVPYAIELFGWHDERMLYYYAHIRGRLHVNTQLEMLKRGHLLTNLKIDMAKAIAQYS